MKKFFLFFILIIFYFNACATKYGLESWRGGYSDYYLGENMYNVSFRGNGYTSSETVRMYFLYRCAEITLNNNCKYFIFINNDESISSIPMTSGRINNSGSFNSTTTYINKAKTKGIIKIFKSKPEGITEVYNAEELKRSLGAYIKKGGNGCL